MQEILLNIIRDYGLIGIFALMTLESALIPIPSEITMPFGGFLASAGLLSFSSVVIAGTLGNLSGSLIAYYLGYWKGERWVKSFIRTWGKWLLLKKEDYARSKSWFKKYGDFTVFVSRLLPVVRTFISLPAGIYKANITRFIIFTTVGSFVWSAFLAWLGLALGTNWNMLEPYFRQLQVIIGAVILLLAGMFFFRKVRK